MGESNPWKQCMLICLTFYYIHILHNSSVPFKQAQHVEQWAAVRRILYSEAKPGGPTLTSASVTQNQVCGSDLHRNQ